MLMRITTFPINIRFPQNIVCKQLRVIGADHHGNDLYCIIKIEINHFTKLTCRRVSMNHLKLIITIMICINSERYAHT